MTGQCDVRGHSMSSVPAQWIFAYQGLKLHDAKVMVFIAVGWSQLSAGEHFYFWHPHHIDPHQWHCCMNLYLLSTMELSGILGGLFTSAFQTVQALDPDNFYVTVSSGEDYV